MAGDNLNVWFDPDGDHLEIVLDQKAGYFEDTPIENVMRKRDAEGNLLGLSIFNLSSFALPSFATPESTAAYGRWAVFNLDVADGETFDFEVALGYERLGEQEDDTAPESTSIFFAVADARAGCSVFFHADRPGPRDRRMAIAERVLEIIHRPLSSPVASVGEDPLSPVSLTSLCRDQLTLSLRLFQPQSFFIFPRGRRREGRGRVHLALSAHHGGALAPYVLRERQVTRFREFARRLWEFHRDRNRYRSRRWDWGGAALASNPDEASFLRRNASKRLSELVGEDGFIKIPPGHLFAFNNLIRASILYFIALQDRPRDEVLDSLDRSPFDPSEAAALRRSANGYWGLPGHEDEVLCSGRWPA